MIKNKKEKLLNLSIGAVVVVIFYLFNLTCPFKYVFKVPCPCCGMTRAYLSLIRLDFVSAFNFNAMFWSVPFLIFLYLKDGTLFKTKVLNIILNVVIILLFILNWIYMIVVNR